MNRSPLPSASALARRGMRTRLRRLFRASAALTVTSATLCSIGGCGGDQSAQDNGAGPSSDRGGQTGSLIPPTPISECGPVAGKDRVLTLAGDTPAFLARGDAIPLAELGSSFADAGSSLSDAGLPLGDAGAPLSGTARVGDWYVITDTGEVVDVPEPSGATPALIQLDDGLEPGNYQLNYRCLGVARSVVLVIEEPRPAPVLVRNATLWYSPSRYTCSSIDYVASLTLTLDAAASSLGDTAQISVVGEDFVRVVAPFGTIEPGTTQLEFGIPICRGEQTSMCIPRGEVALNILTEWVDPDVPSQSLTLEVDATCSLEELEPSTEQAEPGCAVVSKPSKGLHVTWAILALIGIGCGGRLLSRERSRRLASR